MRGMRGGAPALLAMIALAAAGCGSQSQDPPSNADTGDPAATKAVRAEAVRAWLDPEGLEEYENTAVVVVRNTSDKIAVGVTVEVKFPNGYSTSQDQSLDIGPRGRGVFVISNF